MKVEALTIPNHELLFQIGVGGFGEVWAARTVTGKLRAVKIVHRARLAAVKGIASEKVDAVFLQEFEGVQRFEDLSQKSEDLVTIHTVGLGADSEWLFYVMPLADDALSGSPVTEKELDTYRPLSLDESLSSRGPMSFLEAVGVLRNLATGVAILHQQGLVHRDISSSNLLFVEGRLVLADPGLLSAGHVKTVLGSPGFIAPEENAGPAADVFSLGRIFYHMLSGHHPAESYPILDGEQLKHSWIGTASEILEHCCHPDPVRRFADAGDLKSWLGDRFPDGSKVGKHRSLIIVALGILLVAAIGILLMLKVPDERARRPSLDEPWMNSMGVPFQRVTLAEDSIDDPRGMGELWLSEYETRKADFERFIAATSYKPSIAENSPRWYQSRDRTWETPGFSQEGDHPVSCVSWGDAMAYCRWLTQKEIDLNVIGPRDYYRLPTDREWSTAVGLPFELGTTPEERSGIVSDYQWGAAWPPPADFGNVDSGHIDGYQDGAEETASVGSFQASDYGLYDMTGNVAEWCLDYQGSPESRCRAVRGASWRDSRRTSLTLSFRRPAVPEDWRYPYLGFRPALVRFANGRNLLSGIGDRDWQAVGGTWQIDGNDLQKLDPEPSSEDHWWVWRARALPKNWRFEFRAQASEPVDEQGDKVARWEQYFKELQIAFHFASPKDYSAVGIGHRMIIYRTGSENTPLAEFPNRKDLDMAKRPVHYAIEGRGNWLRVFREGVLMLEASDWRRENSHLAIRWANICGRLKDLRLSELPE